MLQVELGAPLRSSASTSTSLLTVAPSSAHSFIKMYALITKLFTVSSFITLAVASPLTARQTSQCNTGSIQCCKQVQTAGSPGVASLAGLLGIVLDGLDIPVGIQCSPLTVGGIGGGAHNAAPVCCENNAQGGLISVGCIPITIEL
ncbi:hydrophobin-domain-containing protein [Heliocybe sulcata]|uniref:Hydrophobin n=1 Tax=Heliocybe sulcata TaxID=5364 RepID=A0A5C3N2A1_9AGAM|nr:hydrophobin-domain-containing protein [Heliocybe sulcata]